MEWTDQRWDSSRPEGSEEKLAGRGKSRERRDEEEEEEEEEDEEEEEEGEEKGSIGTRPRRSSSAILLNKKRLKREKVR